MKPGDFSALAKDYIHRPGYSERVLSIIGNDVKAKVPSPAVADVGAGTGKLTEVLAHLGFGGVAVEPNDAMRSEGIAAQRTASFRWSSGAAEATGLETASTDWVLMGSAFHWTDAPRALAEFHRILRPGGVLTLLWNPRDLEADALQARVEERIRELAPHIVRRSSGARSYTETLERTLTSTGHFEDVVFAEASHVVEMSRERYLGVWRSVNDIQAQAGPTVFAAIMKAIEREVEGLPRIRSPYRTRAWTATRAATPGTPLPQ